MITTLSNVSKLGYATVIVDIVDKGNYEIRPAYAMNPSQIAIHNTGNKGRGAGAKAHNVYIHNMADKTPAQTGYASWHFSVDDKYIYQHIPLNESAWHTGDGSSPTSGNRTAIGIEICENPETDTHKAEENAIALTVYLMKAFGIPVSKVKPHKAFSGKYCPRVILSRDGGFDKFSARIEKAYKGATAKPASTSKAKSHTVVAGDTFSGIAKKYGIKLADVLSYNPRVKPEDLQIGDVVHLVPVPVSKPVSKPAPKPAPKPEPKKETISGIEVKGYIKIVNLNNFTYIYSRTSDGSTRLGKAVKGAKFPIAGSVPNWFEIIHNGKRAYVKMKYGKLL